MAGGAFDPGEVKDRDVGSSHGLMALTASNRDMASRQRKTGLLVRRESNVGTLKGVALVALFAAISPGFAGELAFVHVFMAIDALRELDLEAGKLAGWDVTRLALHFSVWTDQRKARHRVSGD